MRIVQSNRIAVRPLKLSIMTTLKTFTAIIAGKAKNCTQVYNKKTDEISYTVNGKPTDHDDFWKLNPQVID